MHGKVILNHPEHKMIIKGALSHLNPDLKHWDKPKIRKDEMGRKITGRPSRGFGDRNFSYAGKSMNPEPWDAEEVMPYMKSIAEYLCNHYWGGGYTFDFCLVGEYPDGTTEVVHHSDTVPSSYDIVCSMSFGSPRLFEWISYKDQIKDMFETSKLRYTEKQLKKMIVNRDNYLLEHGDVMIFTGESQMNSTHAVPRISGVDRRLNFTFRSNMHYMEGRL